MVKRAGTAFVGALFTLAAMIMPARAQLVTPQQVMDATQKGLDFVLSQAFDGHSGFPGADSESGCFSCHITAQAVRAGLTLEGNNNIVLDLAKLNAVIDVLYKQQFDADADGDGQPDDLTDTDGDGVADILAKDGAITHVGTHTSFAIYPWTTSAWAGMGLSNTLDTTASTFDAARFLRLAEYLLRNQQVNGSLPNDHYSPPVNVGERATTAQAIYTWKKAFEMTGDPRFTAAIQKAAAFLEGTAPVNSADIFLEDASWIVLGLIQAGRPVNQAQVQAMLALIKAHQMQDGGWSIGTTQNNPGITSDAFATGVCACSILAAEGARSENFQEGIEWLINNQCTANQPCDSDPNNPITDGGWPQVGQSRITASTWGTICLATFFSQQLKVTKYYTGPEITSSRRRPFGNQKLVIRTTALPKNAQGNSTVQVIINTRGNVTSTGPVGVLGWAEIKNTSVGPLNSLSLLDTLPVDWMRAPTGLRVLYKNLAGVLVELNPASYIVVYTPGVPGLTPGTGTSGTVQINIMNMTAAIGGPLGLDESILVSIPLVYALKGTNQNPSSYPVPATNRMEASGFVDPNLGGLLEIKGIGESTFIQWSRSVNRRTGFGR